MEKEKPTLKNRSENLSTSRSSPPPGTRSWRAVGKKTSQKGELAGYEASLERSLGKGMRRSRNQ